MMQKTYDVVALGELLIDFTEYGSSEQGNPVLEANPGGAPCNVLSMLQRCGKRTAFIGKVGRDMFGRQLRQAITEVGIDTRGLVEDGTVPTTLAFVHRDGSGDRDFSFYRNPGADMMLRKEEVDGELIREARVFHFGTLSSTHEGVREATRYGLAVAKEAGCIISFDPNLREPLCESLEAAKGEIVYGLAQADVVKISDQEVEFLYGSRDWDACGKRLLQEYGITLVCITLGAGGSRAYYQDLVVEMPAVLREDTIDTTGAGDCFCGCMLNAVLETGLNGWTEDTLKEMLAQANEAASVVTSRRGALRVMPEMGKCVGGRFLKV